jgi:hypothetical protein
MAASNGKGEPGPRRYTQAQAAWAGSNLNPERRRPKGRTVTPGPLTPEEREQLADLLGLEGDDR